MFSPGTKNLLKSVIRQTGTHNRMLEESDMWRQRREEVDNVKRKRHEGSARRDGRSRESDRGTIRGAHMDDDSGGERAVRSTYWARQLQEAEEKDPKGRWGHAGYKELYPEEFISSYSSSDEEPANKQKKKLKKRPDEPKKKKRKKSEKKKKRKKKRKRRRSSSDTDSDSSEDDRVKRKKYSKHRDSDLIGPSLPH